MLWKNNFFWYLHPSSPLLFPFYNCYHPLFFLLYSFLITVIWHHGVIALHPSFLCLMLK
jgi:hypothetical protein